MHSAFATWSVLFFSFAVFALETVLIHIWEYVGDYLSSLTVIGRILIGLAIGSALASLKKKSIDHILTPCIVLFTLGTLFSLFLLFKYPTSLWASLGTILPFVAPGYYLSNAFRDHRSPWIYAWDMLGCGIAVLVLFTAYHWLNSEKIIGVFLCTLLLAGWAAGAIRRRPRPLHHICLGGALVTALALTIFWTDPKFNMHTLLSRAHGSFEEKFFTKNYRLFRSYDNLIARTDVIQDERLKRINTFYVSYSGYPNDHINTRLPASYRHDIRLPPLLTRDPRIFIIGTSAQGIVKTAKHLTPIDRIHGVEVNPAVFTIMNRDFKKESAAAYEGLSLTQANGIAFLKTSTNRFDLITLINAHAMPRVYFLGPPDPLHTVEAYQTYLEHLTDQGILAFEEIPATRRGELSVYRQIATIWAALKRTGHPAPEQHLLVYSWRAGKNRPFKKHTSLTYTGIMVKKTPFTDSDLTIIAQWIRTFRVMPNLTQLHLQTRLNFFNNVFADNHYRPLIAFLQNPSVAPHPFPGTDLSPTSKNRPFSSHVDTRHPQVKTFMFSTLIITCPLIIALLWILLKKRLRTIPKPELFSLGLFQIIIGASYLIIETLLIHLYQPEFLSLSLAFPCVLATLLIASGAGSLTLPSRCSCPFVITMTALSLAWHLIFIFFIIDAVGFYPIKVMLIILSVALTGFFMGFFLPWGLDRVKMLGQKDETGIFIALNSLGGAVAIPVSLYLAVTTGFISLTIAACGLYAASYFLIKRPTT